MKSSEIKVGVRVRTNTNLLATIKYIDEWGDPHLEFDDEETASKRYDRSDISGYYPFGRTAWSKWVVVRDEKAEKKSKLDKKIELYTKMRDAAVKVLERKNVLYLCIDLSDSKGDVFLHKEVNKFVKDLTKFGKKHVPGFYRNKWNSDAFAYEGIDSLMQVSRYNEAKLQHIDMYLAYLRLKKLLKDQHSN